MLSALLRLLGTPSSILPLRGEGGSNRKSLGSLKFSRTNMTAANRFISADEHVQEHPDVWLNRLSRSKWGERIPHVEKNSNGSERWTVNGRDIALSGVADCGAAMPDRTKNPQRWSDVPPSVCEAKVRLEMMDAAGIDRAVLDRKSTRLNSSH